MKSKVFKHFLIFLLFTFGSVRTNDVNEFCDKDGLSCSSDNKSSSHLSKVKNWWKEISVQKPIKCKTPTKWIHNSPIFALFNKLQPVISFPCDDVKYF